MNKMTNEELKLIDKIEKLYKLSESDNINESELALQKAHELLVKHNISVKDLFKEFSSEVYFLIKKRMDSWEKFLIAIIQKYFYCKVLFIRGYKTIKITFIGKSLDIKLGIYTFVYLRDTILRLTQKEKNNKNIKNLILFHIN